jgi:hypothetical protein
MGFLSGLSNLVQSLSSQLPEGTTPQDVAAAASEHLQNLDEGELAGHLAQTVGQMAPQQSAGLAQTIIGLLANHGGSARDLEAQTGVSADAAAAGDPGAVQSLIDYAKNNPGLLQAATSAFVERNPDAIAQFAPGLVRGILGRFLS